MKKEYEATNAANIHDTKGGVYTFEKALYRYPTIQAGVQMAVIEGHSGILLMNFTISELIFLCESKSKKGFRFYQNIGLLNALSHG